MIGQIFLAVITSGCLSTLISSIFTYKTQKSSNDDAIKKALQRTLYVSIKREALEHINDGYISSDDLESLIDSYNAYHSIGGNGWATSVIDKCKALPIKDD